MMTTFVDHRPLWQQTSVQQFLSEVNWDGQVQQLGPKRDLVTPPDSSRVDPNAPLPMNLSVSQFLTSVNWDGATLVAVPMDLPAVMDSGADKNSVFTLNDFSDLF
jgi:hypothetical protein